MWDLWWTKWHWQIFFSEYFSFPPSVSFHQYSMLIFILILLSEGQAGEASYTSIKTVRSLVSVAQWAEEYSVFNVFLSVRRQDQTALLRPLVPELNTTSPVPLSCQLTPPEVSAANRTHVPRINSSDRLARPTEYFCVDFLFARFRGLVVGVGGRRRAGVIQHGILMEQGNCSKSVSRILHHRSTQERYNFHRHGDCAQQWIKCWTR